MNRQAIIQKFICFALGIIMAIAGAYFADVQATCVLANLLALPNSLIISLWILTPIGWVNGAIWKNLGKTPLIQVVRSQILKLNLIMKTIAKDQQALMFHAVKTEK